MERGELKSPDEIVKYVLAGKAIFTLQNERTGNRITYKVSKKKIDIQEVLLGTERYEDLWFVSFLNGADNWMNYRYLGLINSNHEFKTTAKSPKEGMALNAFKWFWRMRGVFGASGIENVHFYHEGRCGRCGRRLTVPESIKSGYGPECINKVGGMK